MKKLFSVILAFVLAFSFAACGKAQPKDAPEEVTQTAFVDRSAFEQNVTDGKIPEMQFSLGQDVAQMITALQEEPQETEDDEDSEGPYTLLEKADHKVVSAGVFRQHEYYYRTDGKVSCIAASDTAFGLESGTFINEIELALTDFSVEKKTSVKTPWLPSGVQCDCLTCTFGERSASFLFVEDQLVKTVVYETAEWAIQ